jgi:hypothetical protein
MVQLVDPAQQQPLDQNPEHPHHQRRQHQHQPVVDAKVVHGHPGNHGPHHEQRTVRKVDDVEQAEDHGQPEAEDCVKRAIDQPQQELAQRPGNETPKISMAGGRGWGSGQELISRERTCSRPWS